MRRMSRAVREKRAGPGRPRVYLTSFFCVSFVFCFCISRVSFGREQGIPHSDSSGLSGVGNG